MVLKRPFERLRGRGDGGRFRAWPPELVRQGAARLGALAERVAGRAAGGVSAPDLLPAASVDLTGLRTSIVADPGVETKGMSRRDMRDQLVILQAALKGKSELALTNALAISYLRRGTPHTAKARALFLRIWREEGKHLLTELSTRWLLSTLQTFADHGETESQRAAGIAGFIYGGVMRMYEHERAMLGLSPDQTADSITPSARPGLTNTGGFRLGHTDALINLNALVYEYALCDEVAGPVLEELLVRVRDSKTVFHRMDQTRKKLKAFNKNYPNAWSFAEEPE